MRSPTRARGRRGAVLGASAAAVVVAAGLLAGCSGDGHRGGYVAVGGAGEPAPPGSRTGDPADPTGGVRLVPLDGPSGSPEARPGPGVTAEGTTPEGAGNAAAGTTAAGAGSRTASRTATPGAPSASGDSGAPAPAGTEGGTSGTSGGVPPGSSSPAPTAPSGTAPAGPAVLTVSDPSRAGTDQRWCEDVTLAFSNSGGTSVRSGTVTFGTHVVDTLGIDWTTRRSTAALPTPIPAGALREKTWTVCVDAWRVPLGMHIETQDVSVHWE